MDEPDDARRAILAMPTFAERFNHLMSTVPRPPATTGQRRRSPFYSNSELGRLIGKSEPYISNLRRNKADNPTMDVIVAIAEVFGVHPGDLIPVPSTPGAAGRAMHLAARAQHLGPRALETLETMVDQLAALDAAEDDR
ncbi:helix-turn-helix domain-containing protein [Actinosynnema sp. CA-248983]